MSRIKHIVFIGFSVIIVVQLAACDGSDRPGLNTGGYPGIAGATAGQGGMGGMVDVAGSAGTLPMAGSTGGEVVAGAGGAPDPIGGGGGGSGGTPDLTDAAIAGAGGVTDPDAGPAVDGGLGDAGDPGPVTGPFPPVSNFAADGPYTSTTLVGVGPAPGYTVYLPTELAPNGAKNPIVGWMSGGSTSHSMYPLLPRLATHGFVVVAADVIPMPNDEVNLGQQIKAGLDWAIAENTRSGSELEGKLNTDRVASMGYSMGSLATFTIADDPHLTTTVHISGGNFAPERINNLHAPAIFICGIPGNCGTNILDLTCDAAAANCDTDFANATTPVFYANFNAGHLGILTAPTSDQIGELATKWLRWKLMDDRSLDPEFLGAGCGVCQESTWTSVQQKNL